MTQLVEEPIKTQETLLDMIKNMSQPELDRVEKLAVILGLVDNVRSEVKNQTPYRKWDELPEDLRFMYISTIIFLDNLEAAAKNAILKGASVDNDNMVEAYCTFVHENYCKIQEIRGYKFGLKYDDELKTDPDICQWFQATEETKFATRYRVRAYLLLKFSTKDAVVAQHNREIVNIAKACHSTWYAYTVSALGEEGKEWEEAPEWQKESTVLAVAQMTEWVREITLGQAPNYESREEMVLGFSRNLHECWANEKREKGWIYGEVKDAEAKTHPCLVDYNELSEKDRKKDEILVRTFLAMSEV